MRTAGFESANSNCTWYNGIVILKLVSVHSGAAELDRTATLTRQFITDTSIRQLRAMPIVAGGAQGHGVEVPVSVCFADAFKLGALPNLLEGLFVQ